MSATTTDKPIRTPKNVSAPGYTGMPQADLPADLGQPPAEQATAPKAAESNGKKPQIMLSTTVQHRGRTITISASDMTVDRFCDLLDAAQYAAPAPAQWQTLPDGTPICPKHNTPMRKREKQGDEWWSHKVFDSNGAEVYCKGYKGKDSPGYEY